MILINYEINNQKDKTICIQQALLPTKLSLADMNGDGQEDLCTGESTMVLYI